STTRIPLSDSTPKLKIATIKTENKIGHKFSKDRKIGVGTP
ncbi:hypothetical protein NT07LI_3192, partial [Listeria innocua FSL S4-378]